jgi:dihydroxyacetone kinase DhaKLM complex PTS-EIIA-like component DhaM
MATAAAEQPLTTPQKVRQRILAATLIEEDYFAAVRAATRTALEEAKGLGWSERTQAGLVAVFCDVGADLFADLAQEVLDSDPTRWQAAAYTAADTDV